MKIQFFKKIFPQKNCSQLKKIILKNQYSIKGSLCHVRYIWGHNSKNYGYGFFIFNEVGDHAYNFVPQHIKIL